MKFAEMESRLFENTHTTTKSRHPTQHCTNLCKNLYFDYDYNIYDESNSRILFQANNVKKEPKDPKTQKSNTVTLLSQLDEENDFSLEWVELREISLKPFNADFSEFEEIPL